MAYTVLIADDHELFRDGLKMVLQHLAPGTRCLTAGDHREALELANATPDLDLVLLDIRMPGMPWEEALRQLRVDRPEVPVVILSALVDRALITTAMRSGARGFIPKTSSSTVMVHAMNLVLSGGHYIPTMVLEDGPEESAASEQTSPSAALTPRQMDVLRLVARGLSNRDIAHALDLSEGTVKLHVTAILKALGVPNRTSAVIAAARMGLTEGEDAP
ncbi:Glycerol metabolism activator [uncultured Alphaproteobacteria bacterium]|uniref:Glycerol metabolism activator n=1 Tax=uncultured Alphaproteobacteria bacterium TaxID=91750 RepID=A0A212KLH6_9PROT|nr:Glycerol metabolism activator [uncultured Alphaproteobacteria bacterium]